MPLYAIIIISITSILLFIPGILGIFFGIFVGHFMVFLIGLLATVAGGAAPFIFIRKKMMKHFVMRINHIVLTDYLDIVHAQYNIGGFKPLIIRSQWFDETNNRIYQYKSSPLSINPSKYLHKELKIPVFINPANPKEYYMDLAEIPELKRVLYDND